MDIPFLPQTERRKFQTPSRRMAAVVTLWILAVYGFLALTPFFRTGIEYDPTITSTLQNLSILAVGYYLGGSNSAANKDETIAHQSAAAIAAATVAAAPDAPTTTGQKVAAVTDAAAITVKSGQSDIEVTIDGTVVPKDKS